MGWRDIRGYVDKDIARIDRDTAEKSRKMSEVTNIIGEGASLWQKHTQGKADQAALEQFGESEGLTFDKKTKSFYGTKNLSEEWTDERGDEFWDVKDDQHYKISPAELKNMQNFSKYTDKGISDFISTKDGNIKKGFQYNLPEKPVTPNVPFVPEEESYFSDEDITIEDPQEYEGTMQVVDSKNISSGNITYREEKKPKFETYEGWRTTADVDADIKKVKDAEMKTLTNKMNTMLDEQTKRREEIEAERIREDRIKNEEKIKQMNETSRYFNPDNKNNKYNQSSMSIMFNGRK